MKHMRYIIFQVFFGWILLSFSSCTPSDSIQSVLKKAELYLEEYPDTALVLLETISSRDCGSQSQKAYYDLLLVQALDKNAKSLEDASIASAVAYYEQSDDSLRKAKAFFYQGRQCEEKEEYGLAAQSFLRALIAIGPVESPKYEALCYSHLGYVNSSQGLYLKSLDQYKRAAFAFKKMGDSINYVISLLDIGHGFILLEKPDSAEYYTTQALRMAELLDNKTERQTAIRNLCIIYSQKKEWKKALEIFSGIESEVEEDDYSLYALLVDVYMQLGQYDTAEYYANHIIKNSSGLYGQATGCLSLYKIAKERQDLGKALMYREQYDLYADSIYEKVQAIKLEEIQKKYDNQELVHEKELLEVRKQRNEWILGSIIVLTSGLLLFIFYAYKREKSRKEQRILLLRNQIQENENSLLALQHDYIKRNREIEQLSLQYKRNNESLSAENEQVRQELLELQRKNKEENVMLAARNLALLNELKKYEDIKVASGKYYETITFIIQLLDNPETARALTTEELDAIESLVGRLFGPLFQSRVDAVGLSVTERKLWCLLQLGFSHASIATFLCITPQSVSKAKFRMKKKIQGFVENEVEKLYL